MTGWLKTQKFEERLFDGRGSETPAGIGIDLISLSRAKVFLRKHHRRILRRLLTVREVRRHRTHGLNVLEFCRLFAAKEAYFKACGGVWMGVEGFSSIEINPLARGRFSAQSSAIRPKAGGRGEGCFFRRGDLVGAEVVIWASSAAMSVKS